MSEETKKCPFCGKEIKVIAVKCRFCGEMLNQGNQDQKTQDWNIESKIAMTLAIAGAGLSFLPFPLWLKVIFFIICLLGGGYGIYVTKNMTPSEKAEQLGQFGSKCKALIAIIVAAILLLLNIIVFAVLVDSDSHTYMDSDDDQIQKRVISEIQRQYIDFIVENNEQARTMKMLADPVKFAETMREGLQCKKLANWKMIGNSFFCKALVTVSDVNTKQVIKKAWVDVGGEIADGDLIVTPNFYSAAVVP